VPTNPTQPVQPSSPPISPLPAKPISTQPSQPTINISPAIPTTIQNNPSGSYIPQNKLNITPDPYPNPTTSLQLNSTSIPQPKKTFMSYFLSQSNFFLLMLLLLSMLLYLLRQFKLRFFINLLSLGILGFYLGGCICPIGMVERIGFLTTMTSFGVFSAILLGILFLVSMFFGRIFCGWVCPQGALQEVFFHGKKMSKAPLLWKKVFVILPIIVFMVSLVIPFFYKTLVFCKVDPFKIPFQQAGPLVLLLSFAVLAILSVLYYRPFCRAICPLGFFLGIGSWLGEKLHWRIFSSQLTCITCSNCSKFCQVDALTSETKDEFRIEPYNCIECGDCQVTCATKKKIKESEKKNS
jgi:polyferredoxin